MSQRAGFQSANDVVHRLGTLYEETLRAALGSDISKPYVILDYPDHPNVGDSAIYSGQAKALARIFGGPPAFIAKFNTDWAKIRAGIPDDAVILLQGGGNFGDIWEYYQNFREKVMGEYPSRRIIQLAQSIHYGTADRIRQTAEAIAGTENLTLLLRDEESVAFATEHFDCDVRLCPDAAFSIGSISPRTEPSVDLLLMLRDDKESINPDLDPAHLPESHIIDDWGPDVANIYKKATWAARSTVLRTGNLRDLGHQARSVSYFNTLAQIRVDQGLRKLERGRFIITDRLHVHILSTLLGIPHAFLDNSYGKIARMSAAFDTRWRGVTRADSMGDAVEAARACLDTLGPAKAPKD